LAQRTGQSHQRGSARLPVSGWVWSLSNFPAGTARMSASQRSWLTYWIGSQSRTKPRAHLSGCRVFWASRSVDPARQEEFNRNIDSLAKWIEGAIQRFRSGVKNSRVIELHNTYRYVFIVDEVFVVREMRKFLLEE